MPAARSVGTRAGVGRQREQPPAAAQQPGDPQPDIAATDDQQRRSLERSRSSRQRPSACGAESRVSLRASAPMPFTVTLQPSGRSFSVDRDEPILSAAIRQGIGLPYGCRDGACGSCKCRLLEGRVIHGAHQSKALSAVEEAAGLIADLPGRAADRRGARGAHRPRRRRVRDPQDAVPRDPHREARARRRDPAPAAAGQRPAALPRRPVRRVHPAGRRAAQLLDGERAAHAGRQARHRAAPAPPAGRPVHRPRVRRDEGEGHPAHRGPVRQLLPARGLRQADGAARLGHRPRADQGDRRAPALEAQRAVRRVLYWGCRTRKRPVPARLGRRGGGRDAVADLHPGALGGDRRRRAGPAAPASSTRR